MLSERQEPRLHFQDPFLGKISKMDIFVCANNRQFQTSSGYMEIMGHCSQGLWSPQSPLSGGDMDVSTPGAAWETGTEAPSSAGF